MSNRSIKILLLLIFVSVANAQNSLIEINSAVDTSRITIGDRIKYEITIDYIDSLTIEHPGAGINLGQFEIKDYKIHETVDDDNRIFQKYEYTISVFDTGSFTIPPFPIAYFPKDSVHNYKIIEANAINIYVESILGEGEQELKDVKAPIYIPFDYVSLISIIAIILLLGLGGYFGYRFYKTKKDQGLSIIPSKPKKPAHEIAFEAYKLLQKKDLLEQKLIKQFYTECSEILRKYLEDRYFIVALEETTGEILRDMKSQEIKKDYLDNLKQILELSDYVKFAKYIPNQDENNTIIQNCIDFVNDTKIEFIQKIEQLEEVTETK
jgi:oxygen tolerance protein BatD